MTDTIVQYFRCIYCSKIRRMTVTVEGSTEKSTEEIVNLSMEEEVALTLAGMIQEGYCDSDCVHKFYEKRSHPINVDRDGGQA